MRLHFFAIGSYHVLFVRWLVLDYTPCWQHKEDWLGGKMTMDLKKQGDGVKINLSLSLMLLENNQFLLLPRKRCHGPGLSTIRDFSMSEHSQSSLDHGRREKENFLHHRGFCRFRIRGSIIS
ncbi:hypothetical protein GcM3_c3604o32 [Golovinomyces cichoracearum]|uniref:Uncharacterized protein n=1 Tax=Golovinomyces cichoracearum TaxID=62708 RepID=A0A420HU45_9PEZI|nr:hypothetical protein GcM3_c3604o32 [Golovinomyces cichoracearum]